jgi:phosphoenolpyruvate-protein phosphotransferase (PTS system enzyme I)
MKKFYQVYRESDNKIQGVAAAPGIIIAKAYLFVKDKLQINDSTIDNIEESIKSFQEAVEKSRKELTKIFDFAKQKMGDLRSSIFEAQLMILQDPVLIDKIKNRIREEKKQPEFIVNDEISKYQDLMIKADESYMQERAQDIEDIKNRIIRNLQKKRWESRIPNDIIVVSDSLTPADTILFTRRNVQGLVTDHGGLTSHAAIISRSLNLPAVVGTHDATQKIEEGDTLIIDGFHGYVLINPDQEQIDFFSAKREKLIELQKELEGFKDKPAMTKDGREITLMANVDVTGEVDVVVTSGAKGIGLYRTEQLLEEFGEILGEQEQVKVYSNLSMRVYPEILTIRAFDIGGDKFRLYQYEEPNPFLGLRGIRLLLENESLFKTQIRAVLKASVNKNIQLMLPMVSTFKEIVEAKKLIEQCKKELKTEGVDFDKNMKVGIMVEVPSAAVMIKDFAKEVDFFSIGTNDLIQYLMAVDRGNDLVSHLYQEFHPAVIRTISLITSAAKKQKIPVSLCGEMAADTLALPLLVGLELSSLSISPATILYAKRIIRNFNFEDAKKLAEECLLLPDEHEVIKRIEQFFEKNNITRTRNII